MADSLRDFLLIRRARGSSSYPGDDLNMLVIPNRHRVACQSKDDCIQGWLLSGRKISRKFFLWLTGGPLTRIEGPHSMNMLGSFFKILETVQTSGN